MANFTIIYNHEAGVYRGKCLEIPGVRPRLEELKANMTDSITLTIKSMDREAQGQRMIIEIPT